MCGERANKLKLNPEAFLVSWRADEGFGAEHMMDRVTDTFKIQVGTSGSLLGWSPNLDTWISTISKNVCLIHSIPDTSVHIFIEAYSLLLMKCQKRAIFVLD